MAHMIQDISNKFDKIKKEMEEDDLEIVNLENVENKEDAESANLIEKQKIRELAFTWSFDKHCPYPNDDEVLEGLRPHNSVQSSTISNFLGSMFPPYMAQE
ncbi:hypothetical protein Sjap_009368 [Stephania japonica]|uniref:R13L1/DRL21-like LRR repeat region domain-containing protein n=1 Tax=Stephania japonica TaxID=461633 RepID=A0AAP0PD86_9MAGN